MTVDKGPGQRPPEPSPGQDRQETWKWGPDTHRGALPSLTQPLRPPHPQEPDQRLRRQPPRGREGLLKQGVPLLSAPSSVSTFLPVSSSNPCPCGRLHLSLICRLNHLTKPRS